MHETVCRLHAVGYVSSVPTEFSPATLRNAGKLHRWVSLACVAREEERENREHPNHPIHPFSRKTHI
jgi:hypothetical protein